jgi:hypothetical protein
MAHIRFVTPNERWFNREAFSEDGGMEGYWPVGGAMAIPFAERRCMYRGARVDFARDRSPLAARGNGGRLPWAVPRLDPKWTWHPSAHPASI